eukprot:403367984
MSSLSNALFSVRETTTIAVPKEFSIQLLLVGGIALAQHYATLYYIAKRKEIYGRYKYMQNYSKDHQIAFSTPHSTEPSKKIHPHGDPDSVDGWYSSKLSYREWYELACAKRAHLEQVENSSLAIIFSLIGGLKFPVLCLGFGSAYLIGTLVFARSYQREGANTGKKCLGRIMMRGSLWVLGGLAIVAAGKLVGETYNIDINSIRNLLKF